MLAYHTKHIGRQRLIIQYAHFVFSAVLLHERWFNTT